MLIVGGNNFLIDCQEAKNALDSACSTKKVASHRLCRTDRHLFAVLPKNFLDSEGFKLVGKSRSRMGIDMG